MRVGLFVVNGKEGEEEIGNVPEIDLKPFSLASEKQGFQARSRGIANLWNDGNGKRYKIDLKLIEAE